MKHNKYFFLVFLVISYGTSFAQVGIGTLTPDPCSVLDVTSITQGILLPRITTSQRDAIVGTAGLLVYNSEDKVFNSFNSSWNDLSTGYKSVSSAVATTTTSITDVLTEGMTITPKAGTYLVSFSSQFSNLVATPATAIASFSIYVNGIQITDSLRKLTSLINASPVELQSIVTVASGQAIEVKWNIDSVANSLSLGNRTLILTKVK